MNTPSVRQPVNPASGFTLIELLVVVSIISLLIAILLPALSSARESARTMKCLVNLRQQVIATHAYSTDYGFMPMRSRYNSPASGYQQIGLTWQPTPVPTFVGMYSLYQHNYFSGDIAKTLFCETTDDPSFEYNTSLNIPADPINPASPANGRLSYQYAIYWDTAFASNGRVEMEQLDQKQPILFDILHPWSPNHGSRLWNFARPDGSAATFLDQNQELFLFINTFNVTGAGTGSNMQFELALKTFFHF